jgi:hypothetical protein
MSRTNGFTRRTWYWRMGWAFLVGVAAGIVLLQIFRPG